MKTICGVVTAAFTLLSSAIAHGAECQYFKGQSQHNGATQAFIDGATCQILEFWGIRDFIGGDWEHRAGSDVYALTRTEPQPIQNN
jgi:hypothetical protein